MDHFGPFWPEEVPFGPVGPPTVLWPFLIFQKTPFFSIPISLERDMSKKHAAFLDLTCFHTDFKKEFHSRTFWRGLPSSVCARRSTEQSTFRQLNRGQKGAERREEECYTNGKYMSYKWQVRFTLKSLRRKEARSWKDRSGSPLLRILQNVWGAAGRFCGRLHIVKSQLKKNSFGGSAELWEPNPAFQTRQILLTKWMVLHVDFPRIRLCLTGGLP